MLDLIEGALDLSTCGIYSELKDALMNNTTTNGADDTYRNLQRSLDAITLDTKSRFFYYTCYAVTLLTGWEATLGPRDPYQVYPVKNFPLIRKVKTPYRTWYGTCTETIEEKTVHYPGLIIHYDINRRGEPIRYFSIIELNDSLRIGTWSSIGDYEYRVTIGCRPEDSKITDEFYLHVDNKIMIPFEDYRILASFMKMLGKTKK